MQQFDSHENISLSTLNILLWMLDESNLPRLQAKGERILLSHFEDLQQARAYRSEVEAQQFMLSNLFPVNEVAAQEMSGEAKLY